MDEREKEAIKEAFAKTKTDIFTLGNEIKSLKSQMLDLKSIISTMTDVLDKLKIEILDMRSRDSIQYPAYPTDIPTQKPEIPTNSTIPSDNPTVPMEIRGLKYPNLDISSGNRGVPTDRQTNQQTDNYREFSVDKPYFTSQSAIGEKPLKKQIQDAEDILNSLDALKKEIRLKFKQITSQEMLVFSTIYAFEEQFPEGVEYKRVASKLQLSESSIRDYIQKLISKGIPVDKVKLNNKKILLRISPKLRNIAPLDTLIKLREL